MHVSEAGVVGDVSTGVADVVTISAATNYKG